MTVLASMQPYLFPYVGYFQLMKAADIFVINDVVAYIRQGWINRNRLKCGDGDKYFTVPIRKGPLGQPIREALVHDQQYSRWRKTFFRLLRYNYCRAPHYEPVMALLERLFPEAPDRTIAELALKSLLATRDYLGIDTLIVPSSAKYNNLNLEKQARLIDICRQEQAETYLNLPRGAALYSKVVMKAAGIDLYFIQPALTPYPQQRGGEFIPGLSILDLMMNNSVEEVNCLLDHYVLV